MMANKVSSKEYWEKNIKGFGGFYDKTSEETLQGPSLLRFLYRNTIFHLEKKYMKQRFDMVSDYLNKNILSGMHVADIGCGSGIYTKHMASMGAKVFALDFTKSALELTKESLTDNESKLVDFFQCDISAHPLAPVESAIAIGVFPYIEDLESCFDNILPHTNMFLFNVLDARSCLNIIRKKMPLLDVRGYYYHSLDDIRHILIERNFQIICVKKLATGLMIEAKKIS
jgi:SAM-dependent methyltransferase